MYLGMHIWHSNHRHPSYSNLMIWTSQAFEIVENMHPVKNPSQIHIDNNTFSSNICYSLGARYDQYEKDAAMKTSTKFGKSKRDKNVAKILASLSWDLLTSLYSSSAMTSLETLPMWRPQKYFYKQTKNRNETDVWQCYQNVSYASVVVTQHQTAT